MRLTIMASAIAVVSVLTVPASAQQLTGTLKKIKDTGTITLGHRESSVPFSYYDDKQQVVGYAMDLCNKIVDAVKSELKLAKLDVKLNPVTSATRIPLIANGTVDLECGSTTNNLERAEAGRLHHHPFRHRQPLRVEESRPSSRRSTISRARPSSRPPAPPTSSRSPRSTRRSNLGLNILAAKDHAEAFLMVETDRAAAFVMDDILLYSLVATSKTPERLRDLRRCAVGRALRHHAAPRRCGRSRKWSMRR